MTGQDLRQARQQKLWTQEFAAKRPGMSQAYLSLLERNHRVVPGKLASRLLKALELSPTALPLPPEKLASTTNPARFPECLGALGYPGFSYLKGRSNRNPADFLFDALMQADLDTRVAEALPWLAFKYTDMDWNWLVKNAKLNDLQNRLGFVVTLACQVAERLVLKDKVAVLANCEALLERSRLAREDHFCHESLSEAEKRWLRERRPAEAQRWNLLTDLSSEQLTYDD